MKKATIRLPQSEIEESSWLKIGEVSKRSGIGIEALRFYEKSGLIALRDIRAAATGSMRRFVDILPEPLHGRKAVEDCGGGVEGEVICDPLPIAPAGRLDARWHKS